MTRVPRHSFLVSHKFNIVKVIYAYAVILNGELLSDTEQTEHYYMHTQMCLASSSSSSWSFSEGAESIYIRRRRKDIQTFSRTKETCYNDDSRP